MKYNDYFRPIFRVMKKLLTGPKPPPADICSGCLRISSLLVCWWGVWLVDSVHGSLSTWWEIIKVRGQRKGNRTEKIVAMAWNFIYAEELKQFPHRIEHYRFTKKSFAVIKRIAVPKLGMIWLISIAITVDCQNMDSPIDIEILITAIITANNIANSWKWQEIVHSQSVTLQKLSLISRQA